MAQINRHAGDGGVFSPELDVMRVFSPEIKVENKRKPKPKMQVPFEDPYHQQVL
jgi:hypothetical protein